MKTALNLLFFALFTTMVFAQENLNNQTKLVGQVILPYGNASLNKTQVSKQISHYTLVFNNQMERSKSDVRKVDFELTKAQFDAFFDQIKQLFKTGNNSEYTFGNGLRVQLTMLTPTDVEFMFMNNGLPQGAFSISATGLHLLFGKAWNKNTWKTFINS